MKLREYEGKVFDASLAADRLNSVIGLTVDHYFSDSAEDDGSARDKAWFCFQYENMQNVLGAIFEASTAIKKDLSRLYDTRVER
ncbi:MAG: hypothetical protein VB096_10330 [Pseudoflavonifractor sp.]|nr:hypothetical protein [Pseudoflavonifractor sp.]